VTPAQEARLVAIVEPFVHLDRQLQARRKQPHFDRVSAVGLALILLGFIGALVAGAVSPDTGLPWLGYIAAAAGFVVEVWGFATAVRRYAAGPGLDALVAALRTLEVSEAEVAEAHRLCVRQDKLVARLAPVEALVIRLQRPEASGPR
jgi:hypothetical protein